MRRRRYAFWTVVVVETNQGSRGGLASAMRPVGHHGGFPVRDAGQGATVCQLKRSGIRFATMRKQ